MTVFPQPPNLCDCEEPGHKVLVEPHLTLVNVGYGIYLKILIDKGFKFDGATIPQEALEDSKLVAKLCKLIAKHYPDKKPEEVLEYLIGTPFEFPRILAVVVHDALYGAKWKWRWLCDRVYRCIEQASGYDSIRRHIEYSGIRLVGWKNWDAVTDLERDRTRRLVKVWWGWGEF